MADSLCPASGAAEPPSLAPFPALGSCGVGVLTPYPAGPQITCEPETGHDLLFSPHEFWGASHCVPTNLG